MDAVDNKQSLKIIEKVKVVSYSIRALGAGTEPDILAGARTVLRWGRGHMPPDSLVVPIFKSC